MRSIHTTNQQDHKNNTPYRVIHKHRTKLGNPIWGIIILVIPIISLSLLSILLASSNDTYADGSVSLSVNNSDTVLELTVPGSVSLNLTPSGANNYTSFGMVDLNILAGTNNAAGYKLSMSTASDTLTRTSSIVDGNGNTITPTISPLSIEGSATGYSLADYQSSTYNTYTLNTWGYKKQDDTKFMPIPTDTTELAVTDSASNATTTTLNLAAKVDSSIPAGTYQTTLNFAMVGNVKNNTYQHIIAFTDGPSSGVIFMYTTFPDSLEGKDSSIGQELISGILDLKCMGSSNLSLMAGTGPSLKPIIFESAPTITLDQSMAQEGKLGFMIIGYGIRGQLIRYNAQNIQITSDTVYLAD